MPVDRVFIGSCTNGRIEDLRAAAAVAKGRKVATGVQRHGGAGLGPGEAAGGGGRARRIFLEAGFEWREPGCSMCLAMNADKLEPGERCASTSNRNFEGRQGRGGRTHLVSPAMAAAAAITGHLADVRELELRRDAMDKFTTLTGVAAPLPMINVDTDMIIPKQFLKTIKRTGLGKAPVRRAALSTTDGRRSPTSCSTSRPTARPRSWWRARISAAARSREHAPWALLDFGIRCVIAPSFADIFYNNCFKNGILPIKLPQAIVDQLMDDAKRGANARLTIDLEKQVDHRSRRRQIQFEIDPFRKHCLLNGLDDIGLTLQKAPAIDRYEAAEPHQPALALLVRTALRLPLSEGHCDHGREQEAPDPARRRHRPRSDAPGRAASSTGWQAPRASRLRRRPRAWSAAPRSTRTARRSPTRRMAKAHGRRRGAVRRGRRARNGTSCPST